MTLRFVENRRDLIERETLQIKKSLHTKDVVFSDLKPEARSSFTFETFPTPYHRV